MNLNGGVTVRNLFDQALVMPGFSDLFVLDRRTEKGVSA